MTDRDTPQLTVGIDWDESFNYNFVQNASHSPHSRTAGYEPLSKTQFLPFTRRHRSNLKGQAKKTSEFVFLRDQGQGDHDMRVNCSQLQRVHKARIERTVQKLDKQIAEKLEILHSKELEKQLEQGNGFALPRRTKYELEEILFSKYDVHKRDRCTKNRD